MPDKKLLINPEHILNVKGGDFSVAALELFRYQYAGNELYQSYCSALGVDVDAVKGVTDIPFLPISFFRTHDVVTAPATKAGAQLVFESSGTTAATTSRHYVWQEAIYEEMLLNGFRQYYGEPSDYVVLALLPSYLERANASLVYMAKTLMAASGHPANGFYIDEWDELHKCIVVAKQSEKKVLLLGVTFALLDFADAFPGEFRNTIVMETGGMKGRKKEMTRAEVHHILKSKWGLADIHSEYGMTELLSQAYSQGNGIFSCTNTMQVLVRDINDPLDVQTKGTGAINVIDLANIYSCAFIATEDIGTIQTDCSFEVLGRMDHSLLRGCNLMVV